MLELRFLCFSRFFEFTRSPKNCIIEGHNLVFPCDLVTLSQNDSNLCQNDTVPTTVQVYSWVSHFILQSSQQVTKDGKILYLANTILLWSKILFWTHARMDISKNLSQGTPDTTSCMIFFGRSGHLKWEKTKFTFRSMWFGWRSSLLKSYHTSWSLCSIQLCLPGK